MVAPWLCPRYASAQAHHVWQERGNTYMNAQHYASTRMHAYGMRAQRHRRHIALHPRAIYCKSLKTPRPERQTSYKRMSRRRGYCRCRHIYAKPAPLMASTPQTLDEFAPVRQKSYAFKCLRAIVATCPRASTLFVARTRQPHR